MQFYLVIGEDMLGGKIFELKNSYNPLWWFIGVF